MTRVLLLGGTHEARSLAVALLKVYPDLDLMTSLSGATQSRKAPPGRIRVGGFGGADGLARYLEEHSIDFLLDATHPFAERITQNAVAAAQRTQTPYLRLDRPQWSVPADTDVIFVPDAHEAARLVARTSKAALLTIGGNSLAAFKGIQSVKLVARVIEAPDADLNLKETTFVVARPPFTVDGEIALMREHGVDTVVTKASGGEATRAKLDAAAQLGLRLVIIRRPSPPDTQCVSSVAEAVAWVAKQLQR
jgi:precorrin-6A/cobalt-precorrin-6A reductase